MRGRNTALIGLVALKLYNIPIIKKIINNTVALWQQRWENAQSKLKEVKPKIEIWPTLKYRREQVILNRLRLGHTRITHEYLFSRGRPPECQKCRAADLTVKHILTECNDTRTQRNRHGISNTLSEVLGSNPKTQSLLAYLEEIGMVNQI